jgi:hypothetical protein
MAMATAMSREFPEQMWPLAKRQSRWLHPGMVWGSSTSGGVVPASPNEGAVLKVPALHLHPGLVLVPPGVFLLRT